MRIHPLLLGSLVALAWVVRPPAAGADELTFSADRDNTLFSDDGTLSNGQGSYLFVGLTAQPAERRFLVHFDVSAIPAGATINSVTLTLSCSRVQSSVQTTVSLHRVSADWGEGSSNAGGQEGAGATASTGDATWSHRFYDTDTWTISGGDFVAMASAATDVTAEGFYDFSGAGLVADVQAWVDGSAGNFGWIGRTALSQTDAKRFDSAQNNTMENRPVLTVDFTPPAATGACCAATGACSISTEAACSGTFQGEGATCAPNPCPQPDGACCAGDGSCTVTAPTSCSDLFLGSALSCVPNQCPQPDGACCGAGGACSLSTALGCSGDYQGSGTTCDFPCSLGLTPFVDALPLPGVAQPTTGTSGGAGHYEIAIRQIQQQLHRDLPMTTLWVYDDGNGGTYPGPTIEARRGAPITVNWTNDLRASGGELRTTHILPVDPCPHGAEREPTRVVTHLHGGHVPSEFDGQPELTILPGESTQYEYANNQNAGMIWYHDHALGITRLNVYAGLAALYLIRDDEEDALGLPSGANEVPLVFQDRRFNADGSLYYPATWTEHFFGDVNLVNGKVWPYFEVDQGRYRFRMLNGANSRTYRLRLSNGQTFQIIGNDGGLLEQPVSVSEITLTPAERADVIIDFSGIPAGTEIFLENSAPAPFPGNPGVGVVPDVMVFRVRAQAGDTGTLSGPLTTIVPHDTADSVATRDFELRRDGSAHQCGGQNGWLINGLGWDDITETPQLGTTEIWRFINPTGIGHPMHMHLVFFQVLERQPFMLNAGEIVPVGAPLPPEPWETGWKDTVNVGRREIVSVIARFDDYVGRFPYHCHILEHEDHEMMRQFETFTTCGDGAVGIGVEECDDGNMADGDGCSSLCTVEVSQDMGGTGYGALGSGHARPRGRRPGPHRFERR